MMPTICEGKRRSLGKKNPVTLVKTVVARKRAVQPSRRFEPSMASRTMSPETIPTRLMTTCTSVKLDVDKPRIMTRLLSKHFNRPCDLNAAGQVPLERWYARWNEFAAFPAWPSATSAPILKFASYRGEFDCELRNQRSKGALATL